MARYDIRPHDSPHGGHDRVAHFPLNAAETFDAGEPVAVNDTGELTESNNDPLDSDLMGIAMIGPGAGNINPDTGVAFTTGDMIPVAIPSPHSYYRTQNWSTDGVTFNDIAPLATNIGDEAGLSLIGGEWGIDIAATNNLCRVMDILDAEGRSILFTGTVLTTADTYTIVFMIAAHQSLTLIAADAPIA
jgi:hypothetical protein